MKIAHSCIILRNNKLSGVENCKKIKDTTHFQNRIVGQCVVYPEYPSRYIVRDYYINCVMSMRYLNHRYAHNRKTPIQPMHEVQFLRRIFKKKRKSLKWYIIQYCIVIIDSGDDKQNFPDKASHSHSEMKR